MIKLITIDLDGTLYDSDSKVTNESKRAIRDCISNGIKVVISTGKSIKSVETAIKELGLVDPQIASGGTVVITPELELLETIKISRNSTLKAIRLARENNIGCALDTTDGKLYYEKEYPNFRYFFKCS